MGGWSVNDEALVKEGVYPTVTEALRAALASGEEVYLHADDCTTTDEELGPQCPCRPLLVRA